MHNFQNPRSIGSPSPPDATDLGELVKPCTELVRGHEAIVGVEEAE
jgi:hypothetical protein